MRQLKITKSVTNRGAGHIIEHLKCKNFNLDEFIKKIAETELLIEREERFLLYVFQDFTPGMDTRMPLNQVKEMSEEDVDKFLDIAKYSERVRQASILEYIDPSEFMVLVEQARSDNLSVDGWVDLLNNYAQINNDIIIDYFEKMSENSEEELSDFSELMESYWNLSENPININSDEIEQLADLKIISIFQLESIKNYRKNYGDFQFLEEL